MQRYAGRAAGEAAVAAGQAFGVRVTVNGTAAEARVARMGGENRSG